MGHGLATAERCIQHSVDALGPVVDGLPDGPGVGGLLEDGGIFINPACYPPLALAAGVVVAVGGDGGGGDGPADGGGGGSCGGPSGGLVAGCSGSLAAPPARREGPPDPASGGDGSSTLSLGPQVVMLVAFLFG